MPIGSAGRVEYRLLVGILVGVLGGSLLAQDAAPDIPFTVRRAEQIGDAERQAIATYVKYWSEKLTGGDRSAAAEAKDKLSTVVDANVSNAFRNAYSDALGPALETASQSEDALVRIAAMIAASGASTSAVTDVCKRGLSDANAGVRYHAAKAIADIMGRWTVTEPPPIPPTIQTQLLAELKRVMTDEQLELVYYQMGRAISSLSTPAAFADTLALLNARLVWLRDHPTQLPSSPRDMLYNLLLQINRRAATGENVDAQLRDLTAAAGRCLRVLVERIQTGGVTEGEPQQAWAEVIDVIENDVFKRAIDSLAPGTPGPGFMERIRRRGWNQGELDEDILRWIGRPPDTAGILTTSAIAIPLDRLLLPGGAAPATSEPAAQ